MGRSEVYTNYMMVTKLNNVVELQKKKGRQSTKNEIISMLCLLNIYTVALLIFLSFFNSYSAFSGKSCKDRWADQERRTTVAPAGQCKKSFFWGAIINSTLACIPRQRKDLKQQTPNSKYISSHRNTLINDKIGTRGATWHEAHL